MNSKPRNRPRYKLLSEAEQEALARRREAERQGRVAFHHGKSREACAFREGDPLRQIWLDGLDHASKRRLRADMLSARAKGHNAFADGLRPEDCPLGSRTPERTEWLAGWEEARVRKEKDDYERFR
jgi:ribosome modulation factor